ncbi:MAG: dipeptidase E [Glaciecola sp.]|jgi:dipeptidase E
MLDLAKVLMLSSSRKNDEPFLYHAKSMIQEHLIGVTEVLFLPFAGVTTSWNDYTAKVQEALPYINLTGIHQHANARNAIESAQAVLVGGGNTFNLLNELYNQDLLQLIQQKVILGLPYIGWSAGSNLCGLSIKTSNDMPIIQPLSFDTFGFINAQLNPHYTDYVAPDFNGETRDQRIAEFCTLYPEVPVICIREGSALLRKDKKLTLIGQLDAVIFTGKHRKVIPPGSDISIYL